MPAPALPPLALNHLNLRARDPKALARWYADVLGFRANGPFLWSAGTLLVLSKGDPFPSGSFHFGFRAATREELDAWVASIAGKGVTVPPIETFDDEPGYATTFIHDPEGNEIELFVDAVPA